MKSMPTVFLVQKGKAAISCHFSLGASKWCLDKPCRHLEGLRHTLQEAVGSVSEVIACKQDGSAVKPKQELCEVN